MEDSDEAVTARHGLFFEVLARDEAALQGFYEQVFGWTLAKGPSGFSYVSLPGPLEVRGGVGQALAGQWGQQPGVYFYVMVEDIDATLLAVQAHEGAVVLEPTAVDGYRFAMFQDPEYNIVGLVAPFPPLGRTTGPVPDPRASGAP